MEERTELDQAKKRSKDRDTDMSLADHYLWD